MTDCESVCFFLKKLIFDTEIISFVKYEIKYTSCLIKFVFRSKIFIIMNDITIDTSEFLFISYSI